MNGTVSPKIIDATNLSAQLLHWTQFSLSYIQYFQNFYKHLFEEGSARLSTLVGMAAVITELTDYTRNTFEYVRDGLIPVNVANPPWWTALTHKGNSASAAFLMAALLQGNVYWGVKSEGGIYIEGPFVFMQVDGTLWYGFENFKKMISPRDGVSKIFMNWTHIYHVGTDFSLRLVDMR